MLLGPLRKENLNTRNSVVPPPDQIFRVQDAHTFTTLPPLCFSYFEME